MKICPFCANEIQDAAIKCQHCHERLDTGPIPTTDHATVGASPAKKTAKRTPYGGWRLFLIGLGLVVWIGITGLVVQGGQIPWVPFAVCTALFVPLASFGWRCGDLIRRFATPDFVFVGDGSWAGTFWSRLHWTIGPQTFGVCAAFAVLLFGVVAFMKQSPTRTSGNVERVAVVPSTPSPGVVAALRPVHTPPPVAAAENEPEEDVWEERISNDEATYSLSIDGERELRFTSSDGSTQCSAGVGNNADVVCANSTKAARCYTDEGGGCEPASAPVPEPDDAVRHVVLEAGQIIDIAEHGIRCIDRGGSILCVAGSRKAEF